MSKLIGNFRLDEHHRQILKMRAAASGMNQSEYIRSIIERDNQGRFRKPSSDDYREWESIRSSITLSDSIVSLLEAMKKEYDETEKCRGKKAKNLKELCEKYGLDIRVAKEDVKWLVKNDIFTKDSTDSKKINWTIQGVMVIPEYAPAISRESGLVEGSITDVLCRFWGDYDEVISFLNKNLQITVKEAKTLFCFLLGRHQEFLKFLREIAFDSDGLISPDNRKYHRIQMLHFLYWILLTNEKSPIFSNDMEENQMYKKFVKSINDYLVRKL